MGACDEERVVRLPASRCTWHPAAQMARELPTTHEHRGPTKPRIARRRQVLIAAFPRPAAAAVPDSGATIGRAWLEERGLGDREVSTSQLRIDRAGGGLRIADVGSRNGTWVNGTRLERGELVPLDDGALLRFGRTVLVFREELLGELEVSEPIGGLVGPYGLRSVTEALRGLSRDPPKTVLVEGETGVGKELVARAVAAALGRSQPFAAINVAALAPSVFESHVFGHVAGAFSGARADEAGIVRALDGGTLFLDEIGELALELQAKLLRTIENGEVLPVGARRPVRVDVSFVAATNRALGEMVERGAFRRDLLARLAMVSIRIPPLRERREDVFAIAGALARRSGAPLDADHVEVEAVERLVLEPWASNVRGLDAALAAVRRIDAQPGLRLWALEEVLGARRADGGALTARAVQTAIEAAAGNVTAAAAKLGVSRGKLLRMRKRNTTES